MSSFIGRAVLSLSTWLFQDYPILTLKSKIKEQEILYKVNAIITGQRYKPISIF